MKKIIIVIVIIVVALFAINSFSKEEKKSVSVVTEKVEKKVITKEVSASGSINKSHSGRRK